MALFKEETVTVSRKEWDALRKDVQEVKEMVAGMASAMSSMAEASAALSNSPMGKMLGNLFPGE
jgi:hypothetical protein